MAINFAQITRAVEEMLKDDLNKSYTITRNAEINDDPNLAAKSGGGWIGIYRSGIEYSPATISSGRSFDADMEILVIVQTANMNSAEAAEDRMQAAEAEVLNVLLDPANFKLKGTVQMINGFSIEYEVNNDKEVFWYQSLITIKAQQRVTV